MSNGLKEHKMNQTQHYSPMTQYFLVDCTVQMNYRVLSFCEANCKMYLSIVFLLLWFVAVRITLSFPSNMTECNTPTFQRGVLRIEEVVTKGGGIHMDPMCLTSHTEQAYQGRKHRITPNPPPCQSLLPPSLFVRLWVCE